MLNACVARVGCSGGEASGKANEEEGLLPGAATLEVEVRGGKNKEEDLLPGAATPPLDAAQIQRPHCQHN